jgi:hypothetical protein
VTEKLDRTDLPMLPPIAQHEGGTLRAVRDGDVVEFRAGVAMDDGSERATYFAVPLEVMRREIGEPEVAELRAQYASVVRLYDDLRTRVKHHLEVSQDQGDCPCCGAHINAVPSGKHQDCDMFTPDGEVK